MCGEDRDRFAAEQFGIRRGANGSQLAVLGFDGRHFTVLFSMPARSADGSPKRGVGMERMERISCTPLFELYFCIVQISKGIRGFCGRSDGVGSNGVGF